jgi:stage III sporulation protein AD
VSALQAYPYDLESRRERGNMTVVTIAVTGIIAVILAVSLKGVKGEYGTYVVMAAGLLIFFYGLGKLTSILDTMKEIQSYIKINNIYLSTLVKMIGITYIAEFAAGICKDAGYGAVGTQIEIFGKLSVLAVSMPILLALIETLQVFVS